MNTFLPDQDCLFIESLRFNTTIGVYDHEQEAPQPIIIDLAIGQDLTKSSQSDQLQDTIDYDRLLYLIEYRLKHARFSLLEGLGEAICQDCFETFSAKWVKIRLHKPQLFDHLEKIGVQLVRKNPKLENQ